MQKLLGCLIGCLLAVSVHGQQAFFNVKGKQIIGPDQQPFLIRGTNLGNWLVPEGYMFRFEKTNAPRMIQTALLELIGPGPARAFWQQFIDNYIRYEDIQYIRQTGANSIRIPFHYKLFTSQEYLGSADPDRGFAIFDRVLDWCRKEKLYVILDMHCAPGGQTGDNIDDSYGFPFLFTDTAAQNLTVSIWKAIARRYHNDPIIIGYDLLNEPIAHYFDAAALNPLLEPLYKRITAAIRTVDPNHLIFLGGAQWNSNFKVFGPPFDAKLVYSFHKYWTPATREVIQDYLDFSNQYNVPLYCGETGENTDAWVDSFRVVMEAHDVGWHYWPYKKLDNQRGFMSFDRPALFDSVIAYTKKPRSSFEQLRMAAPVDRKAIQKSLDDFLRASLFENCRPNTGYIKALGLDPEPKGLPSPRVIIKKK